MRYRRHLQSAGVLQAVYFFLSVVPGRLSIPLMINVYGSKIRYAPLQSVPSIDRWGRQGWDPVGCPCDQTLCCGGFPSMTPRRHPAGFRVHWGHRREQCYQTVFDPKRPYRHSTPIPGDIHPGVFSRVTTVRGQCAASGRFLKIVDTLRGIH